MRSARIALVTAIAAAMLAGTSPAQARHLCELEDPVQNFLCESHLDREGHLQELYCTMISPIC